MQSQRLGQRPPCELDQHLHVGPRAGEPRHERVPHRYAAEQIGVGHARRDLGQARMHRRHMENQRDMALLAQTTPGITVILGEGILDEADHRILLELLHQRQRGGKGPIAVEVEV